MYRTFRNLPATLLTVITLFGVGNADVSPTQLDVVRLSVLEESEAVVRVAIQVLNNDGLAAIDIPIQFGNYGDPIMLEKVTWSDRVADWDFRHAAIDNEGKTVILGAVCELIQPRTQSYLKIPPTPDEAAIVELEFRVDSEYMPDFRTFRTELPTHELSFVYNVFIGGLPQVNTITPRFEVGLEAAEGVLPSTFALSQNTPNPFNPSTSFTLSLPEASDYAIRIVNITGQLVKSYSGRFEAGVHTITWDGRNLQGTAVASGTYLYSVEAGGFSETRRMMLLK